jgi:hypothetical protein
MATRKTRASKRAGAAQKRAGKTASNKRVARSAAAKKKSTRTPPRSRLAARAKPVSKPRARAATKTPSGRTRVVTNEAAVREAAAIPRADAARRTAEPAPVDTSLFPCGEEALRAATGKGWSEWLALLDAAGAAAQSLDHPRILELAMQSLPDSAGWWAQMVSVGYERVRGLREKHESCNGEFQATLSKTFPVPLFAAFAAWADATLRRNWLDAPDLSFTKLNAGKNIRARWPNGALLDIRFNATGPDKCQIVVDTRKLGDAEAVRAAKAFWQAQFDRLQEYLRG